MALYNIWNINKTLTYTSHKSFTRKMKTGQKMCKNIFLLSKESQRREYRL